MWVKVLDIRVSLRYGSVLLVDLKYFLERQLAVESLLPTAVLDTFQKFHHLRYVFFSSSTAWYLQIHRGHNSDCPSREIYAPPAPQPCFLLIGIISRTPFKSDWRSMGGGKICERQVLFFAKSFDMGRLEILKIVWKRKAESFQTCALQF